MRLRWTAVPRAFLMLQPNRLKSRPFGRIKTVNSRLDLRRPALYTASYSTRRNNRQARGSPSPGASDAREAMTSLFAALRKDLPSTLALHALTKAVLFVTAAHMRLKSAFRQESSPLSWAQTIARLSLFSAQSVARGPDAECLLCSRYVYVNDARANSRVYQAFQRRGFCAPRSEKSRNRCASQD
jgi:hypothetical protein